MVMRAILRQIFRVRVIRYGVVGGIGIPVHLVALAVLLSIFGTASYPISLAGAFEVSTTINFVLNQLFTYSDKKIHGWQWIKRAIKAQLTSISALALTYGIAVLFTYR